MSSFVPWIAVDLGASSGRLVAGFWNGSHLRFEALHRFPNGGVAVGGNLVWNAEAIRQQIQVGLGKLRQYSTVPPAGVGIDSWGVDFGLLDRAGQLLANPFHYRDRRTEGLPAMVAKQISESCLYARTGVQPAPVNTLFQLWSMVRHQDSLLDRAHTLLMIPDLYAYLLSGERCGEFTNATTTQMYSHTTRGWDDELLFSLQLPIGLMPDIVQPGTILGSVRREVVSAAGISEGIPMIATATHDTASAVAGIPGMDANSAFICCGTWSLVGIETARPDTSAEALRLGFTNEGGPDGGYLLLRNLTGLWILQECIRAWQLSGTPAIWTALCRQAALAPGLHSLIDPDHPEFQQPCDMPAAIRRYCASSGQPIPQSRGAITRTIFDSLALAYRCVIESVETLNQRNINFVRMVGGGSRNPLLCQLTADALGRPVIAGPAEASACGNILIQALATRHLSSLEEGRMILQQSISPQEYNPQPNAELDEAYARFRALPRGTGSREHAECGP